MSMSGRSPKTLWVYAYEVVPPQPSKRLDRVRALLEGENLAALSGAGSWAGRLILEQKIVHILIVSDNRDRNREINWQLEAELERIHATYTVTEPLAVARAEEPIVAHYTAGGNGK